MSLSLRDQLLQAGLLDPKKAQQPTREQRHQRREQGKKPPQLDPRVLAQQKAAEEKAARDAELNRKQQEKLEQKARRAAVKQLVEQHRVARPADSEQLYNFLDGKRIRRIPVDPALREKLVAGSLVIVRCDGRYELVPAEIGDRIAERDPHARVAGTASDTTAAPEDPDDPYKDYKVPDDLMW